MKKSDFATTSKHFDVIDNTVYSYKVPIVRFINNEIHVNSRYINFSRTTNNHISIALKTSISDVRNMISNNTVKCYNF